jgi:hypothetical protein
LEQGSRIAFILKNDDTIENDKRLKTMIKHLFILISILLFTFTASAETLRLNSGESLEGKILKMDEKTLFIESHLTAQELKIDRADLSLIEFDSSARSLARRLGIGLHYRPNGNEENLSIKNWISAVDSAELIVGYSSGTQDTFGCELRYSRVFMVEGATDLFYGAGAGILAIDSKRGTIFRLYSGSEFFPLSSPSFGFSLELGVQRKQGIGDVTQGFYNAIAARYYF